MLRIEVYEKYSIGGEIDLEYYQNLKIEPPAQEFAFRRTMILIEQVERPIEIVGNKKECILRMWSGEDITVKCNYDEMCIILYDAEMALEEYLKENE